MDKTWYNNLNKSILTPPNYIFSIVWSFLYFLIFVSFSIYIKQYRDDLDYKLGLLFFIIQLILNLSWSTIFFKYKNISKAYNILILIIIFVNLTIYYFRKIDVIASKLLIPYILWLYLAMYLNYYIIKNNLNLIL
jgi:tryptophan-rich sensory protein